MKLRSKRKHGIARTLLLGVLAFAAMCYALLYVLEIPTADVLMLVALSIALTVMLILIGFFILLFIHVIKKLF